MKDQEKHERYTLRVEEIGSFILIGRLVEYKYYNIDDIVTRVQELFKETH